MKCFNFQQAEHEEARRLKSLSKKMVFAGWALAFLAATLFVDSVLFKEQNSPRVTQTSSAEWPLILPASSNGLYFAHGTIDGVRVEYVIDTGAVVVGVSEGVANAAGMQEGAEVEIGTANGRVIGRLSKIHELRIGSLTLHDVDALVLDNLVGGKMLLGMNALKELEFVQAKGMLKMRPIL